MCYSNLERFRAVAIIFEVIRLNNSSLTQITHCAARNKAREGWVCGDAPQEGLGSEIIPDAILG